MAAAGYSARPLAQKLGLKPGMRAWFQDVPDAVRAAIDRDAPSLQRLSLPEPPIEFAHIFVTSCAVLDCELRMLLPLLDPAGMIWVSWPKKASKVPTDITEDVIREVALPLQLVDVKVCAVDEIWSGLKLVIRKEHR
ncbi:DUF3052 domain-containing protein [Sphingomonas sp. NSE70-1]|uniref:DUF3052 domain-containing protein n=1 Tax=Sphingomonas caseinilyticus TaxID=2908205 RepID=A0ABT0RWR3_9SPHN|nr:DUF3052 domain-containing protein [Sphingomonas caseinilyticus]MCL6699351.1 DUF3052 domain-containing protein [Sphingomonas caseinilyticus]